MAGEMESVAGTVIRITFENPQTGYRVIKVQQSGSREEIAVVGTLPDVLVGQEY
ncbi:hypothetical protein LSG31_04030 [Fodinisporobacter ferrooxydans]|uniref:ATP-dependent RecD2 DNA helicase OB-fold domain-containing protein n=1 Tax=Fodinisporobacter ferrooxydans TaxID=2901836 RepID=A0ABY4CQC1_9BACL|nr:hypothetical protein LSG31_04030 [Alicyclobacillaceae bacterium MYW30-H2]